MAANDPQCPAPPLDGEAGPMVLLVGDTGRVAGGQFPKHSRDGRCRDAEALRNLIAGGRPRDWPAEFENGLQVIVDGFRFRIRHS